MLEKEKEITAELLATNRRLVEECDVANRLADETENRIRKNENSFRVLPAEVEMTDVKLGGGSYGGAVEHIFS